MIFTMTWIYIVLFLCGIQSAHVETIIHSHQWWLAASVAAAAWWKCGCQSAPPPSDHCWTFTHGHARPCGWDVLHKEADRDWDGAGFKPPTLWLLYYLLPTLPPSTNLLPLLEKRQIWIMCVHSWARSTTELTNHQCPSEESGQLIIRLLV